MTLLAILVGHWLWFCVGLGEHRFQGQQDHQIYPR